MSRPFLLAVCRPPGAILDNELHEIPRLGGFNPDTELEAIELGSPDSPAIADINLERYSGVFITGSKYGFSETGTKNAEHRCIEEKALQLCEKLLEQDVPTLGFCYGIQALALAGGGSLSTRYGEDICAPDLFVTPAGREDPILRNVPEKFSAFVGHKDAVDGLPRDSEVLVRGTTCPVQMLRIKHNCYATQFHPEITNEAMHIRLEFYNGSTYFDPATAQELWEQCDAADISGSLGIIGAFVNRYRRN